MTGDVNHLACIVKMCRLIEEEAPEETLLEWLVRLRSVAVAFHLYKSSAEARWAKLKLLEDVKEQADISAHTSWDFIWEVGTWKRSHELTYGTLSAKHAAKLFTQHLKPSQAMHLSLSLDARLHNVCVCVLATICVVHGPVGL